MVVRKLVTLPSFHTIRRFVLGVTTFPLSTTLQTRAGRAAPVIARSKFWTFFEMDLQTFRLKVMSAFNRSAMAIGYSLPAIPFSEPALARLRFVA